MKNRFCKKTAAGLLALLIIAGAAPVKPITDLFGGAAITASAEGEIEGVTYIDENGEEQTISEYTVLDENTTELTEGWYVVDSSFTNPNTLKPSGNVNIILTDDHTMDLEGYDDYPFSGADETTTNLTIYGQSKGTGKIVLSSYYYTSVYIKGSLTINGGTWFSDKILVKGTDPGEDCLTFNGGNINIGGFYESIYFEQGKCSINGGQVVLNSWHDFGFWSPDSTLYLGYTKATDLIYTKNPLSDGANVRIADGMVFTDGTNIYDSSTPSETLSALTGVTLTPANAHNITAAPVENGTVTVPTKAFAGDTVTLSVAPDAGHTLRSITVKDADGNAIPVSENQFTMPEGDVTITAEFEEKPISSASLTLGDDLGLNFYMSSAITDENAADYTVKFEGECLENEATLTKNESSGKYYATAHVYAKNLDKKIMAKLYKGEEVICTTEYSVADYLEKAPETVTDEKALALIKATKAFGAMSADYFYEGEHGFSAAYNEYLTQSNLTDEQVINHAKNNYATEFTTDDAKISLVLDEKTAIRLYVKGVQPDGENLKPSKQANKDVYPSYYEIAGLTPDKLADEQTVTIGGVDHKFSALSWANRILNQDNPSEKNLNMAKAVTAYYLAAHNYDVEKHTVDLSQLTDIYYAKDGDILTGTTDRHIYVSGVTVTLKDAEAQNGIYCEYNSTILLEGTNKAPIQIQRGTLTIDGEGSLVANGSSGYAGIGGGSKIGNGANLIINGGNITANGGSYSAGIGGNKGGNFGNITINGGIITANGNIFGCTGIGTGTNGGNYSKCGDITINGGTVTAIGTNDAPGIGSVYSKECGNITIADTVVKVTVIKGERAPYSIGVDNDSDTKCGTITIGGNVYYEDGAYVNGGEEYLKQDEIVYPAPIDLSALTEDYEAKDGDTLTGTLGENVKISVADGATVTLKDVTINGEKNTMYSWAGINCEGNAKIILEGENNVKGFYEDHPGIFVPVDKTLTIDGTGSLNASSNGYGAGIGGGYMINCGNIIIEGGTLSAEGGNNSAGIGSGNSAKCGNITINGGTVIANGGESAAGIGSGYYYESRCGNITINGGTVTATGGENAAGIGGGYYESICGDITINGGTVTANGGEYAAGIGSGYYESICGDITINGGTVIANGGEYAAGIGSGYYDSICGNITIADTVTQVTATKGNDAPLSIGAGKYGTCGTVTIAYGPVEQN